MTTCFVLPEYPDSIRWYIRVPSNNSGSCQVPDSIGFQSDSNRVPDHSQLSTKRAHCGVIFNSDRPCGLGRSHRCHPRKHYQTATTYLNHHHEEEPGKVSSPLQEICGEPRWDQDPRTCHPLSSFHQQDEEDQQTGVINITPQCACLA